MIGFELLKKCTHMLIIDGVLPLTDEIRFLILEEAKKMASKTLYVYSMGINDTDVMK